MAIKTWYATSSLVSVHQEMSETDPGTEAFASPVTGWVVGTTGTGTGAFNSQVESSTFSGTNPDGSIDTSAGDCLRTTSAYTGTFASGNWTVNFCVRSNTVVAGQGRMLCRLFRSANADGSSATEINAGVKTGSTVTMSTSTTQNSTVTFNPGSFSVTNEFIFIQLAWERISAGGMSTSDVNMRVGNSASLGTRVVTPNLAITTVVSTTFTATTALTSSATYIPAPAPDPYVPIIINVPITYRFSLLYPSYFEPEFKPPVTNVGTTAFSGLGALATTGTVSGRALEIVQTFTTITYRYTLLYPSLFEALPAGVLRVGSTAFTSAATVASAASHLVPRTTVVTATGTLVTARSHIIPRISAFAATGSVVSAASPIRNRTTLFSATGALNTVKSGLTTRTTLFTAAGTVTSVASHIVPRSTTVTATGTLATARSHIIPRTSAFAATATLATPRSHIIPRTTTFTANGTLATTKSAVGITLFTATGTLGTTAAHIIPRTTSITAAGLLVTARSHIVPRTSTFSANGTLTTPRSHIIPRTTTISATGTLTTPRSHVIPRTTLISANGTLATLRSHIISRSTLITANGALAMRTIIIRKTTFTGSGQLVTAKLGTIIRTTAFTASATLTTPRLHIVPRTTAISATGTMASARARIVPRTTTFSASGAMVSTASGLKSGTTAFSGAGSMTTSATLISGAVVYEVATLFTASGSMDAVARRVPRPTAIIYNFPIGKSLGSDYGRRGSQMAMRYGYRPKIRNGSYR